MAHLDEVCVGLDGSLIATGALDHPTDRAGHFPSSEAALLRISRREGFRIVRCRANRDRSGFLDAEEYGSELHLPASLAAIVDRALKSGVNEELQATLAHQDGALRSSTSRIDPLEQPLTDWRMHVDELSGAINVQLSARLHGSIIPEWKSNTGNFWPAESEARVSVRFQVGPATRVACFGAYIPSLVGEPGTPATAPTSPGLDHLDIANAPVGTFCQFGISGSRWYSLYEDAGERRSLTLTEHGSPTRNSLGLLNDSRRYIWPRVSIHGLDMETIASLLRTSSKLRLAMTGSVLGDAYESHGSDGSATFNIKELVLDLQLDATGLQLKINADSERGKISMSVLFLWELLILRFPYFTPLIQSFKTQVER